MAKRCTPKQGCGPRANWWKQALGVDWFNHNNGTDYDPIYSAYGTDFDDLLLPSGHTWNEGSYNSTTEGTYSLTATDGSTIDVVLEKFALKIDPSNLYTMFQEGLGADVNTEVSADGQNVGTIYDLGKGIPIATTGTLPTLTSDAAFNSLIKAGSVGLQTQRLTNYWKPLHDAVPEYCMRLVWKFEAGSDGLNRRMYYNNALAGSTATDAGPHIRRRTDNKLELICYEKQSGQNVYSYITTQTVTVASGIIWVTININGVGASAGTIHIKTQSGVDVSESFAVNAGSDVTPTSGIMTILGDQLQSMGALQIMPRIATAAEITAWKTHNPTRHSTAFLIKNRDFNPTQAQVFSDASATVVITDGGNMRYIKDSSPSPFGELPQYIATADASAPIWTANSGKPYALYNGSKNLQTSDLQTSLDSLIPEGCGRWTLFIVASNTDATFGSHYLAGGGGTDIYMVQVGENYVGGAPSPYLVTHPNVPGFATNFGTVPAFSGDNIFVTIRDRTSIKQLNNALTAFLSTTCPDPFSPLNIGTTGNGDTDWSFTGRLYRIIKYSGAMSETRAKAIRDELKAFYGIA
jgi:hypothetical protein